MPASLSVQLSPSPHSVGAVQAFSHTPSTQTPPSGQRWKAGSQYVVQRFPLQSSERQASWSVQAAFRPAPCGSSPVARQKPLYRLHSPLSQSEPSSQYSRQTLMVEPLFACRHSRLSRQSLWSVQRRLQLPVSLPPKIVHT